MSSVTRGERNATPHNTLERKKQGRGHESASPSYYCIFNHLEGAVVALSDPYLSFKLSNIV